MHGLHCDIDDLDPAYFVGDLLSDHSGNSVARWQNRKYEVGLVGPSLSDIVQ